jgi:hypothetical protein
MRALNVLNGFMIYFIWIHDNGQQIIIFKLQYVTSIK